MIAVTGCAATDTYWGRPERVSATGQDMSSYGADSDVCLRESRQQMGIGDLLASRVQRDADRLYALCMKARGYEVEIPEVRRRRAAAICVPLSDERLRALRRLPGLGRPVARPVREGNGDHLREAG